MKAQRIHCFAGVDYYPWGGMSDYVGSFATTDDGWAFIRSEGSEPDWVHFVWMDDDGNLTTFLVYERNSLDAELKQVTMEEHHRHSVVFPGRSR